MNTVSEIRSESAYPTFRAFIVVATGVGYLIAVLAALTGAVAGFGQGHLLALVVGCIAAVVIGLAVAIVRELSLMLADIADATLHMAAGSKEGADSYMKAADIAGLAVSARRDVQA